MAADTTVQVINHHQANLHIKETTTSTGVRSKSYITTTVKSEPITFMLDEGAVAKAGAEMLARRIREQTQGIAEVVKPATAKARQAIEKAYAEGKAYAVKRYSGGRIGATPPVAGAVRMFNHSGRLARSIVARYVKSTKEWAINYAANRWRVEDFGSAAQMAVAFQKWVDRVPVLQDASSDLGIQRAIRETFAEVIQKQQMGADHKTAMAKGRAKLDRFRQVAGSLSDTSMSEQDEEEAA